jgi:hypothetical protein
MSCVPVLRCKGRTSIGDFEIELRSHLTLPALRIEPRIERLSLVGQSHDDPDDVAENALQAHAPTAIESFQINATLSHSTLDPELSERLGLQTPDDSAGR